MNKIKSRPPFLLWDIPTRLFHWTLVTLIGLQYATAKFHFLSMNWHYRFGYATLALILFRIIWGFIGSQTARFHEFVRTPRTVFRYLCNIPRQRETTVFGHNPIGGWSVILMLTIILGQIVTGLFTSDDISESGLLADKVSDSIVAIMTRTHHLGQTLLLIVIALHVFAIGAHWVFKRDNLLAPMIHGQKYSAQPPALQFVSGRQALAVFAICNVIVWAFVIFLG